MASYPIGKAIVGLMAFPSMTQSSLCKSRCVSFLLTGQRAGFTSTRKIKSHSWKSEQPVCPVSGLWVGLLVDTSQTTPPASFSRNWGRPFWCHVQICAFPSKVLFSLFLYLQDTPVHIACDICCSSRCQALKTVVFIDLMLCHMPKYRSCEKFGNTEYFLHA